MIFVGDISLPYTNAIQIQDLPDFLKGKSWFGNLEGAIVQNAMEHREKKIVYNDPDAIRGFARQFNVKGFALANNHVLDAGRLEDTLTFLEEEQLAFCGLGANKQAASTPLVVEEEGCRVVLLNFGWEVIQCEVATAVTGGVNPLRKGHVLEVFDAVKDQYPDSKIVLFFHWNYELEAYPQPFERELARLLIDKGAGGIIGCHPHRAGGVELYKDAPIVYSLGNWMFLQRYYYGGRIAFPECCNLEMAFEWNFATGDLLVHFFEYKKKESVLQYLSTEDIRGESPLISQLTPFAGFPDEEYVIWYRKNRYHKRKGLPIYYWNDHPLTVAGKNNLNKFRDKLIATVVKFRRKPSFHI